MPSTSPVDRTSGVYIDVPPRLTRSVDIASRTTVCGSVGKQTRGALTSIDLNCPSDLFYGYDDVAAIRLTFQNKKEPVGIEEARVGHFRLDNNIDKLAADAEISSLEVKGSFETGVAEILLPQPDDDNRDEASNVRIVVLLSAYPSRITVSVSLSTEPATKGIRRFGRTFTNAPNPDRASFPDEKRLQDLLRWTAGLGYERFFEEYLDQVPFGPNVGLNEADEFGITLFSWVALAGKTSMIQLALQHGGCSMARRRTTYGPAPLEAAARNKDEHVFKSFLKLLKYFDKLDDENPGHKHIPTPNGILLLESLPPLDRKEIQNELNTAVRGEQTETIRRLVNMILEDEPDKIKKEEWIASQMLQAAEEGALCLIRVLFNAKVKLRKNSITSKDEEKADTESDTESGTESGTEVNEETEPKANPKDAEAPMTPLMIAIANNNTNLAEFLIIHDSEDQEALRDALRAAVKQKRHNIIRTLLQVGTVIEDSFKRELLNIKEAKKDTTTTRLLKRQKFTGKLATYGTLHSNVDKTFKATVANFCEENDPTFKALSVDKLMKKPEEFFKSKGRNSFSWFHLPANNMKWAEALISKIYHDDPSSAYKVLDPKRWVKRQHKGEGEGDSIHARFMVPACHDFSEAFKDKKSSNTKDKHVVLFMPYLHWDEEKSMKARSTFITKGDQKVQETIASNEENLMNKYLLSDDGADPNSRHVLHIRRTLDQSVYHNLKDTTIRDSDQTIQRYQRGLYGQSPDDENEKKVIMVDQLWLWILVGQSGKAETVVTCFPSSDWPDGAKSTFAQALDTKILDQRRATDILQITKSYIQQRPTAVRTAYDLAGLIASRCSRALLDHSADMISFAEVYENSISYIMNEESSLFDRFNKLMQTRTNVMEVEGLKEKNTTAEEKSPPAREKNPPAKETKTNNTDGDDKKTNHNKSLASAIEEDLNWLRETGKLPKGSLQHCLKYHRYTLETEIPHEKEIKKLQNDNKDEKKNMDHLVNILEKFGRFYVLDITREITLLRQIKDIQDELEMMEKIFADQKDVLEALERIVRAMLQPNIDPNGDTQIGRFVEKSSSRRGSNSTRVDEYFDEYPNRPIRRRHSSATGDSEDDGDDSPRMARSQGSCGPESRKWNNFNTIQAKSIIWDSRHQKENLPIRTVLRHSEQIKKMYQRAKNTNKALNTLVDLKQKQNNMIDTRTARLQAEESHRMTVEAEKQGRILMVFTVVTIVFLPLSFIAAFFAIPVQEFGGNKLSLGFVSKITFPASAALSLLIIVVGYSASYWRLGHMRHEKSMV